MSDELKPCPFCGVKNTDVGFIDHAGSCYLMQKYMNSPKNKLIAAWNRRPLESRLKSIIALAISMDHSDAKQIAEFEYFAKEAIQ